MSDDRENDGRRPRSGEHSHQDRNAAAERRGGGADPSDVRARIGSVKDEIGKRLIGQDQVVEQLLACLLCNGNALLESNPGLGKTTLVRTVSDVLDLQFARIQHTPDLMPADITGTEVIRETEAGREFRFEEGPIFANIVLADEINRATPKTQAALLEAMEERQVTVSDQTYELPRPFFVIATQNPVDQEGTYRLPEAQTDRFLMKIELGYPDLDEESAIISQETKRGDEETITVQKVLSRSALQLAQQYTREVPISDDLHMDALKLVRATRDADFLEFGASPRASIALVLAAKARAFIRGRSHVNGSDIERMALPVLRHRIILDFQAQQEGMTRNDAIKRLL